METYRGLERTKELSIGDDPRRVSPQMHMHSAHDGGDAHLLPFSLESAAKHLTLMI